MRRKTKEWLRYLPRFGCICTGIIYGSVGVLALLSFFKVRHGGADELLGAMAAEVEHSLEDAESGLDTSALANTVLRLSWRRAFSSRSMRSQRSTPAWGS